MPYVSHCKPVPVIARGHGTSWCQLRGGTVLRVAQLTWGLGRLVWFPSSGPLLLFQFFSLSKCFYFFICSINMAQTPVWVGYCVGFSVKIRYCLSFWSWPWPCPSWLPIICSFETLLAHLLTGDTALPHSVFLWRFGHVHAQPELLPSPPVQDMCVCTHVHVHIHIHTYT